MCVDQTKLESSTEREGTRGGGKGKEGREDCPENFEIPKF